jgi:hypothetical protein
MRWSEFAERQPRLAVRAQHRLIEPGVLLVVTLRRDGTPRLSPVEPYLLDGRLLLSMLWGSLKAKDLGRDPRVLVHSIVTNRDGGEGELKVRGTAQAVDDHGRQERYAVAVGEELGWQPVVGRFHLFEIDIEHITFIRYDHETGDQHVATWPPAKEFVRRGTSATSVGAPQPQAELLDPSDSVV